MADHDKHDHHHEPGRSRVALFQSPAEAREAIAALHKAHYTRTWLGVTSLAAAGGGEETMTVESQVGGFFSGTQSLVDALVSHGVLGDTARELEVAIEPGEALVTVDPKDKDVAQALSILERHGGRVGSVQRAGANIGSTSTAMPTGVSTSGEWEGETFYRPASVRR